ncbi:PREDICTED: odorant receptor 13a-like [Eufriesea mexicana]|uniref:odorant receptor 13a-like n=1 Tax=Eufriesea mexicana TaxID=516756 RepID=UPI00083C4775|nr:PREDICTED: odorant receptor 13a-like [Eufriesea mexicana]
MNTATVEDKVLKFTKKFAKYSGIWPDQNKLVKYILWTMTYIIIVPSLVVQVARMVHFFNITVITEQLGTASAMILVIVKQGNYIVNATKYKALLTGIYKDWAVQRSKEEVAILSTYAARGSFLTSFYLVNAFTCSFLFITVPWTARLLYTFSPQNASLPMLNVIPGYYFVEDDRKYYYYIQLQMSIAVITVVIVFIGCDTSYVVIVQHACGLLSVAGHRFKHAINDLSSNRSISEESIKKAYQRVRFSIQGHERAITYLKEIESAHIIYLFICMCLITVCFGITLLKVVTMDYSSDFLKYSSFLIVQMMHLSYLMIQGQFVINASDEVYDSIYEALWYNSNSRTQALYILALRRSLSLPRLTAGRVIELNMQTFSEVVKLSISYYTVLKST